MVYVAVICVDVAAIIGSVYLICHGHPVAGAWMMVIPFVVSGKRDNEGGKS